tara:strand:+ start:1691 stop:2050 length:360 start_codon:yes stop_codon:yes gene_type:complete
MSIREISILLLLFFVADLAYAANENIKMYNSKNLIEDSIILCGAYLIDDHFDLMTSDENYKNEFDRYDGLELSKIIGQNIYRRCFIENKHVPIGYEVDSNIFKAMERAAFLAWVEFESN